MEIRLTLLFLCTLFLVSACGPATFNLINHISLPEGFTIETYADVPNARSITLGPKGIVFVGTREDKIYAVVDDPTDYKADVIIVLDEGLNSPSGVAYKNGSLYVAEINRILRYNVTGNLSDLPEPEVVYDGYPADTVHGWKFIRFGPDGKLYVPIGAPCNACFKEDPRYASITRINTDGTGFEIIARGVRNTVGFDWHPETHELWFTDNGRDMLGDDIPADELNRLEYAGQHFGFPFCHATNISDPDLLQGCEGQTPPIQELGPYVAPLGMRFYNHTTFGPEYHNAIFIAEHGSWNRKDPIGYRITTVTFDDGKPEYTPFAEGWLDGETVIGRPVDIEILPDGSLLVSDDYAGKLYRVYKK